MDTWWCFSWACDEVRKEQRSRLCFLLEAADEEAEIPTDLDSRVHRSNLQAWYWLSDNWSVGLMSLAYTATTDKSRGLTHPTPPCQYGSSLQTEISDAQKPGYSFEQIMPLLLKDCRRCQQELPLWWLGLRGGLGGKAVCIFSPVYTVREQATTRITQQLMTFITLHGLHCLCSGQH